MFQRELMIKGLREQQDILEKLIKQIQDSATLQPVVNQIYDKQTKAVSKNLKSLRKIKEGQFN